MRLRLAIYPIGLRRPCVLATFSLKSAVSGSTLFTQQQQREPLYGDIHLHCIASIAYHSDIFISLPPKEKKKVKRQDGLHVSLYYVS